MSLLRDLRTLCSGFRSVATTSEAADALVVTANNLAAACDEQGGRGYSPTQLQR
jgi:hypothetical protein